MDPAGGKKSKEIASSTFIPMEALFLKAWEFTQFVNFHQRMHVVRDVLGAIRIFVDGGSQRVVCQMSMMTPNCHILM
jgi:hypothetical protein